MYRGVNLLIAVFAFAVCAFVLGKIMREQAKPMIGAAATMAAHALWFAIEGLLTGQLSIVIGDALILAVAATWLATRPGIVPVLWNITRSSGK